MRTEELLHEYEKHPCAMPESGWKQLVWIAAQSLIAAKKSRNTALANLDKVKSIYTQETFNFKMERR